MKNLLTIIAIMCLFLSTSLFADVECAPQLRSLFNKIQQVPEAKHLITEITKEGDISILVNNNPISEQFGACWDVDRRMILVSFTAHRSKGELIGSILFELHNALVNAQLNHLDDLAMAGKISRDNYVEAVEYLEYKNSKSAAAIAEKGIQMGVFPRTALLPTYRNFEEHYHYQKVGGHSYWIARNYDELAPRLETY